MQQRREAPVDYLGEKFEDGTRDRPIPPIAWRRLGQRVPVALCLLAFSAVFFIGAFTVIGWIL